MGIKRVLETKEGEGLKREESGRVEVMALGCTWPGGGGRGTTPVYLLFT